MGRHSPTLRRRRLAGELRRLREAAGLTCEQVADELDCSASKVSRIETARLAAKRRDVRDMLDMYGIAGDRREELLKLTRESQEQGWWHVYEDVVTEWFSVFIGLESEARSVRTFEGLLVPGLLQTQRYARAAIDAAESSAEEPEIDRWAALRSDRQEQLNAEKPLQLWTIIDEAALRRPVGGPEVMREQLEHLLKMSELRNVTVQVLPFAAEAHASLSGPFHILEFPEPADPDAVYLENQESGLFLEAPEKVRQYCITFEHLRAAALGPQESATLITGLADDLA